ncbi:MAG TPA: hypothetical protein VGE42_14340 [Candidatus Dormibacteraeota bacterium]
MLHIAGLTRPSPAASVPAGHRQPGGDPGGEAQRHHAARGQIHHLVHLARGLPVRRRRRIDDRPTGSPGNRHAPRSGDDGLRQRRG